MHLNMSKIRVQKLNRRFSLWDDKAITNEDHHRIIDLISSDVGRSYILPTALHKLFLFATNTKRYHSNEIPKNVITLHAEFILTTESYKKQLVRIVLPKDIKEQHDVSVYSPIGVACLGAREKDQVIIKYKDFKQKLLIEKIISQPTDESTFYS